MPWVAIHALPAQVVPGEELGPVPAEDLGLRDNETYFVDGDAAVEFLGRVGKVEGLLLRSDAVYAEGGALGVVEVNVWHQRSLIRR